jgi:hypothetical protein
MLDSVPHRGRATSKASRRGARPFAKVDLVGAIAAGSAGAHPGFESLPSCDQGRRNHERPRPRQPLSSRQKVSWVMRRESPRHLPNTACAGRVQSVGSQEVGRAGAPKQRWHARGEPGASAGLPSLSIEAIRQPLRLPFYPSGGCVSQELVAVSLARREASASLCCRGKLEEFASRRRRRWRMRCRHIRSRRARHFD